MESADAREAAIARADVLSTRTASLTGPRERSIFPRANSKALLTATDSATLMSRGWIGCDQTSPMVATMSGAKRTQPNPLVDASVYNVCCTTFGSR